MATNKEKFSYKFDIPQFGIGIERAIYESMKEIGHAIEKEAKDTAPRDTGDYANNIKFDGVDTVTAHKEYSAALEYGVKARTIFARNAKALHFIINGKDIFCKSVNQKARPPRPTMRNAAKKLQGRVQEIFERNLKRV